MMLDDQEVTEEWIVRVQGTEYGPANIETLREWKAEGRLLPPMKRAERMSIFGQRQRKFPDSSVCRRRCQSAGAFTATAGATLAPQLC